MFHELLTKSPKLGCKCRHSFILLFRCTRVKIGVFNAMEGCDGEIEMKPGMTEASMGQVR